MSRLNESAQQHRVDSGRLRVVLALFSTFGLYNGWKVFSLQVLQYNTLSSMAQGRIKRKDTIAPKRGLIYDARGQLLAGNAIAQNVYTDKTYSTAEKASLCPRNH